MKKVLNSTIVLSLFLLTLSSFSNHSVILLPTSLKVTVLDKNGNIVKGVTVTLYKNEADYFEEKDPIREGQITDEKGRTVFKKLTPAAYYIYAKKER